MEPLPSPTLEFGGGTLSCGFLRCGVVFFISFYIYSQDPVQESHMNYQFFGVYEDMFIIKWP